MLKGHTLVMDIGKTYSKVSLWDQDGSFVAQKVRANKKLRSRLAFFSLNARRIEAWLLRSLRELGKLGEVARIVTVGHGAAAAMIRRGSLYQDPMDYEQGISDEARADYDAERDPFHMTGSPLLPQTLNLGVQLHLLELELGPLPKDVLILPWPQYWAWRLCGVPTSEVTSLGCHTDLWWPNEGRFSELAGKRGWAALVAPMHRADEVLGRLTPEMAEATGINQNCEVLCGVHDSNAALLAARGHSELAGCDATVLSTGTWFVAMRSLPEDVPFEMRRLDERRDCLVKVDVRGRPVPSARFMGGREAERLSRFDTVMEEDTLLRQLPRLIRRNSFALPSFAPGAGPFADAEGDWHNLPRTWEEMRAATLLYLALVADISLELIGSRDRLLIEGRFATETVFVRALAALRPGQQVYTSSAEQDLAYGALRLVAPELEPESGLTRVEPLQEDMDGYAEAWREACGAD